MTTILTIGFSHPDSARLLQELQSTAPQYRFESGEAGPAEEIDAADSVGLIWCPRSTDGSADLISSAIANGLPVVALLQESTLPGVDLMQGHVEFSFPPSNTAETLSRIELVQARARGPVERNIIVHGDLVIDQDRYEVTLGGKKVDLTYKEYELLKYIAARPGRVFSREALLRAVWDYDYFGGTRTVDVHVRRLRSKINDVRYQFIETVWNVGYRFRAPGEVPGN